TVTLYRNGVLVPTASTNNIDGPIHPISMTMPLTLGRLAPSYDPNLRWTDGVLDDVAIWNEALTADQISNAMTLGADGMSSTLCLGGLTCTPDEGAGTATLSWNPPDPALDATGIKVERDGVEIASLPLTAAGHIDSPPLPGNGEVSFNYTVHTYGGTEGDGCPVRSCTADFDLGTPGTPGMIDLSDHFDEASDFSAPNEEYHDGTGTFTSSVTDDNGGVQFQTTRSTSSNASYYSTVSSATFNPSTQGAITDINWSNEVRASNGI
ncbi:MAG: LamG domain-containing protein, partial [bacterium]|nr:LamG domain-containing protein [bacterium]